MNKIIKNIALIAAFVLAGSGCVPTHSKSTSSQNHWRTRWNSTPTRVAAPAETPTNLWSMLGTAAGTAIEWSPTLLSPVLGVALASYQKNIGVSTLHAVTTAVLGALPLIAKITGYNTIPGAIPLSGASTLFALLGLMATTENTRYYCGFGSKISDAIADPCLNNALKLVWYPIAQKWPKLDPLNWLPTPKPEIENQ